MEGRGSHHRLSSLGGTSGGACPFSCDRFRHQVRNAIEQIEQSLAELPGWADELLADVADYADDPEAVAQSFCGLFAGLPPPAPGACA